MAVKNSSRKWMFIGGGVVAAVALVIGFQNYPPQPKDSTGTIGGAQRYHEPQITGADVKVSQDELTTWLQSDTFDRIVKDPEARRLFTNESVQRVLAESARNEIKLVDDARGPRNQAELANDVNKQLTVANEASRQMLVIDDLQKKLSPSDFALLQAAFSNDAIRDAMSSAAFRELMANDASRKELVSEARKGEGNGKVD